MRFYLNSGDLLRQLVPHEVLPVTEENNGVSFIIYKGYLDLWSENATTGMAIETEQAIVAYVPLDKTLQALRGINQQQIILELHEYSPSKIYATRLIDEDKPEREQICFILADV